jgi:hypothetical protein
VAMCALAGSLALGAVGAIALTAHWVVNALSPAVAGPVSETDRRLTVELLSADRRHMRIIDLPGVDDGALRTLAGRAIQGTLSESDMAGVFSRSRWHEVRQRLLDGGLLAWRSPDTPARGLVVTPQGRQVFGQVVELPQE